MQRMKIQIWILQNSCWHKHQLYPSGLLFKQLEMDHAQMKSITITNRIPISLSLWYRQVDQKMKITNPFIIIHTQ